MNIKMIINHINISQEIILFISVQADEYALTLISIKYILNINDYACIFGNWRN